MTLKTSRTALLAGLAFGATAMASAATAQTPYNAQPYGSAQAQVSGQVTTGQTTQDRLGAVVGALFGDRLGLSQLDQAWLRGGRPVRDGQSQFGASVDTSLRSGQISTAASVRLKADYDTLVRQEATYGSDGGFSAQERADLTSRYNALNQTLTSGGSGYGDNAPTLATGRAEFETRVDASLNARRITRTAATQLKTDYQSLIQVEAGYLQDGSISAQERADLDARADALDARVDGATNGGGYNNGAGGSQQPVLTSQARIANIDAAVNSGERSGSISRTDAADIRIELGDLTRLEAAYGRGQPSREDTEYLTRRLGELELRARINAYR